ncbi:MAG: ribosomal protein L15 family protein, partial [Chitinophagia bacterium]|nr:ribosomal protein L15 family protein [Chitinophagia bacterium]
FSAATLYMNGLASKNDLIKILASGEMKAKVAFKVNGASAKAKEAIVAAGSTIEII